MFTLTMHLPKFLFSLLLLFSLTNLIASQDPLTTVRESGDRFLTTLKNEQDKLRQEPKRVYSIVERDILSIMDFERFARFVLGAHWRQANPSEQQRFIQAFRSLLVRTYSKTFIDHAENLQITYLDTIYDNSRKRALVRSRLRLDNASEIAIDYKLYEQKNQWKVYDVEADGISIAITFRSAFMEEINRLGLQSFLESLETRDASGEVIQ